MNPFSKRIAVALSCLLVFSCIGKGGFVENEVTEGTAFILPTSADYEVPEVADYNIDITLRDDLIDNKLIMLESGRRCLCFRDTQKRISVAPSVCAVPVAV